MTEIIECRDGVRLRTMGPNDLIASFLRRDGDYEPHLKDIAARLIGRKQGRVVDVGANIGTFVIPMAKRFPSLRFLAFEVQAKVFVRLLDNCSTNGCSNIRAIHCGLSDEHSSVTMSIPKYEEETNVGAFSLDDEVRANDYEIATDGGEEEFILRPLDSYHYSDVILVKIDVEGMEEQVLRGATETLRDSYWPPVIFEAWTWKPFYAERRERLFGFLKSLGYEVTTVGENNIAQHVSRADRVEFTVLE